MSINKLAQEAIDGAKCRTVAEAIFLNMEEGDARTILIVHDMDFESRLEHIGDEDGSMAGIIAELIETGTMKIEDDLNKLDGWYLDQVRTLSDEVCFSNGGEFVIDSMKFKESVWVSIRFED